MGRSSRSQANANRARIVEFASGLFRAHAIEAVSISDVMKAAGMTQGGFYKHFTSKERSGDDWFEHAHSVRQWGGLVRQRQES